jgi:hypothetical protein
VPGFMVTHLTELPATSSTLTHDPSNAVRSGGAQRFVAPGTTGRKEDAAVKRLGPVAQLLTTAFPEMSDRVRNLFLEEAEIDEDLGTDRDELSPYELYSIFRTELLVPSLAGGGRPGDLRRCCEFLTHALALDHSPDGHYRTALFIRVFHRLTRKEIETLVATDKRLKEVLLEPEFNPDGD